MSTTIRQLIRNRDSVVADYERMGEALGKAVRIAKPEDLPARPSPARSLEAPGPEARMDWQSLWDELVRITHPFHL